MRHVVPRPRGLKEREGTSSTWATLGSDFDAEFDIHARIHLGIGRPIRSLGTPFNYSDYNRQQWPRSWFIEFIDIDALTAISVPLVL